MSDTRCQTDLRGRIAAVVYPPEFSNNFPTATSNPKGMTLSTENKAAGPHFHKQWVFLWNPKPSGMRIIFR